MQHHPAEITRSESECLWFRPLQHEAPSGVATATLTVRLDTILPPLSCELSLSFDQDSERFVAFADTQSWPLARRLEAQVAYLYQGRRVTHSFTMDCLPAPWRPLVEPRDLVSLMPQLATLLAERERELDEVIEVACEELHTLCRLRGFPPGACRDKARLDELLRLRAMALAFTRQTPNANDSKLNATREWQRRAERAFASLLQDAPIDARFVDPVIFAGSKDGVRMCP